MSSADPLLELLSPHLIAVQKDAASHQPKTTAPSPLADPLAQTYLSRLSSLSLPTILNTEPAALQASSQSLNVAIQSLSSRSHKALITSSKHLSTLSASVNEIQESVERLSAPSGPRSIHVLDKTIQSFLQDFQKDSSALQDRSNAHLLSRNLDRILDILELPTLLSSSISSGNYPTSLDILAHVRRLVTLYPASPTILSVSRECEGLQRTMVSNLIGALRGSIKLPTGIKTVGWLKRAVPEMGENEDVARGVFLVCRLGWVEGLFQALEPLKELADDEKDQRLKTQKGGSISGKPARRSKRGDISIGSGGQHTERYLKRWIEIFREQSFAVVSMYRSIFPESMAGGTLPTPGTFAATGLSMMPSSTYTQKPPARRPHFEADEDVEKGNPPPPLSTFIIHLIMLLEATLKTYLPNIQDKGARESLLTQVLYAAGSLGRLDADFSGIIAWLGHDWDEEEEDNVMGSSDKVDEGVEEVEEWVEVMKKHRVLASRLEQLAAGGGATK